MTSSLGLGRHQELFLEVEIRSSRYETRIFSTRFLYPLDHKISTRLGSQDGALIHTPTLDGGWFGSIWNGCEGKEILEKMEVGKDTKECFTEMGEYRKM